MNNTQLKMFHLLKDLKENHGVIGIKAEFEAEGTRINELTALSEVVYRAGSEIFLKIGGCEAVSDIDLSRFYGVKGVIAPMIETPFALKKFAGAIKKVYGNEQIDGTQFLINIETKTGYENIDDILSAPEMDLMDGAIIGRVDLSASYGYDRKEIESDKIYCVCRDVLEKLKAKNKVAGIGGAISNDTILTLQKLNGIIDRAETRKIIFDVSCGPEKLQSGLSKAIEFEYLYILNLAELYGKMSKENEVRLQMLKARIDALR